MKGEDSCTGATGCEKGKVDKDGNLNCKDYESSTPPKTRHRIAEKNTNKLIKAGGSSDRYCCCES